MRRDPAKALQLLRMMNQFFDGGRRWHRGSFYDDHDNRCLVGALAYVRRLAKISGDGTAYYLRQAQPQWRIKRIAEFNDECESYLDIAELIERARRLATAELARTTEPERLAA
jgi:hypothetical protein